MDVYALIILIREPENDKKVVSNVQAGSMPLTTFLAIMNSPVHGLDDNVECYKGIIIRTH